MPKVKFPLFSRDVRGAFGKQMIFTRGGVVRRYFKPRNPKTEAQQEARRLFLEMIMAGLTKEQADLLYAAIVHPHDDLYSPLEHVHDHGTLSGLGDDDHSQYLTQGRGDARYLQLGGAGLTGLVTNANDIFRRNTTGGSGFVGTIASKSSNTLVYNVTSGDENVLVPISADELGKMRLYNSTRGTYLLITACNVGTNTLTFSASVPSAWQVGDTIKTKEPSLPGGAYDYVDLELVSGELVGKGGAFLYGAMKDNAAGQFMIFHPFEGYSTSKQYTIQQQGTVDVGIIVPYKLISNVIRCAWTASGAGTMSYVLLREIGFIN